MKVVDNNGYAHNWPPKGYQVDLNDIRPRSDLHMRTRALLRLMYPTQRILEEIPIPGEQLFLDFYLPHRKIAIECNGEQHYKFVPHFHGNLAGFAAAKVRDKRKHQWCNNNNITLIELSFEESDDEWRRRIENPDTN